MRTEEEVRQEAVRRWQRGDQLSTIARVLKRSRPWVYKWIRRYDPDNPTWYREQSRRPHSHPRQVRPAIEQQILDTRQALIQQGLFCGAQAIQWELDDVLADEVPSLSTINRVLARHQCTERVSRPKPQPVYPIIAARRPNDCHQADIVGPCYLAGGMRFHSLNVVDVVTHRCAVQTLWSCSSQHIVDAYWAAWQRLGMPRHLQVDNEMSYYGSPRYPRAMGALIRLCLHHRIEPWFIPVREPWRNGLVEYFNRHYRQKFLARVTIKQPQELQGAALTFESRHNTRYRYSVLNSHTPMQVLEHCTHRLRFPMVPQPPRHPLVKPRTGTYHVVRFIRSDGMLNIFSERFALPACAQHEYVVATVDVKEQRLKVTHPSGHVTEFDYILRPKSQT
jgi:transposase InsO family protein